MSVCRLAYKKMNTCVSKLTPLRIIITFNTEERETLTNMKWLVTCFWLSSLFGPCPIMRILFVCCFTGAFNRELNKIKLTIVYVLVCHLCGVKVCLHSVLCIGILILGMMFEDF